MNDTESKAIWTALTGLKELERANFETLKLMQTWHANLKGDMGLLERNLGTVCDEINVRLEKLEATDPERNIGALSELEISHRSLYKQFEHYAENINERIIKIEDAITYPPKDLTMDLSKVNITPVVPNKYGLLPCPFCFCPQTTYFNNRILCDECTAEGPIGCNEQDARENWDRRAK